MTKLFSTISTIPSTKYGDLTISWFVFYRPDQWPVDPALMIDPESVLERLAIEELFTEEEAKLFQQYLKRIHDDNLTITEEFLPNEVFDRPLTLNGTGDGYREVLMEKDGSYDLPFIIHGSFYLFENIPDEDMQDPQYTFDVEKDLVSTSGGDPIGMVDEDKLPIPLIFEYIKNLEDQAK